MSNLSWGQNPNDTLNTKVGFSISISSAVLEDNVKLFVHLPFCYKPDQEYPLVLLLDGNTSFKSFASATELLAYDGTIPCCIVVGFPQYKYLPSEEEHYMENVDRLMNFLENDFFSQIGQRFKINDKIIWGQGHLLPTYAMLTKPSLFDGYISDIPDLKLISNQINTEDPFKKIGEEQIYYYLGANPSINVMNEKLLEKLRKVAPKNLHWTYQSTAETIFIKYVLTNYLTGIVEFFNQEK